MNSRDPERIDFELWADETGYPLTDEPGGSVGKPLGDTPGDALNWARIEDIPIKDLISPEEFEQFRPPSNPDDQP